MEQIARRSWRLPLPLVIASWWLYVELRNRLVWTTLATKGAGLGLGLSTLVRPPMCDLYSHSLGGGNNLICSLRTWKTWLHDWMWYPIHRSACLVTSILWFWLAKAVDLGLICVSQGDHSLLAPKHLCQQNCFVAVLNMVSMMRINVWSSIGVSGKGKVSGMIVVYCVQYENPIQRTSNSRGRLLAGSLQEFMYNSAMCTLYLGAT